MVYGYIIIICPATRKSPLANAKMLCCKKSAANKRVLVRCGSRHGHDRFQIGSKM